jgi:group II intron maturase
VRSRTIRSRGDSLGRIIGDINPTLRGWYGYFQHATPGVFRAIDGFVRSRLRAILRKQEKRPGFGRCKADHQRWPIAFFAAPGLFTLQTTHATARHSRCGNRQLESRVRENRTHGSEGGEAAPSRPLSRWGDRGSSRAESALALARLHAWVLLVDDIDAAVPAHDAAVLVACLR